MAQMQVDLEQNTESAEDLPVESYIDYDQQAVYSDRENDDAMLHYDPDNLATHQYFDHLSQSSSSSLSSFLGISPPTCPSSPLISDHDKAKGKESAKKKRRNPTKVLESPHHTTITPDSETPIQTPPAPTTKAKEPRSQQAGVGTTTTATKSTKSKRIQITDDELFSHLKDSIFQDTQLYLRILRYEVRLSILFLFCKTVS